MIEKILKIKKNRKEYSYFSSIISFIRCKKRYILTNRSKRCFAYWLMILSDDLIQMLFMILKSISEFSSSRHRNCFINFHRSPSFLPIPKFLYTVDPSVHLSQYLPKSKFITLFTPTIFHLEFIFVILLKRFAITRFICLASWKLNFIWVYFVSVSLERTFVECVYKWFFVLRTGSVFNGC